MTISKWRCGKCDGLPVPEHHRTCPLRVAHVPDGPVVRVRADTPELQRRLATLIRRDLEPPQCPPRRFEKEFEAIRDERT
jgi:hypothetical protein